MKTLTTRIGKNILDTENDFNYENWLRIYETSENGSFDHSNITVYPLDIEDIKLPKYVRARQSESTNEQGTNKSIILSFDRISEGTVKTQETAKKRAKKFFEVFSRLSLA
jgi:hypothetical protein